MTKENTKDYLRLLCTNEDKEMMAKAIEDLGLSLAPLEYDRPENPMRHANALGEVIFWIFEVDVDFDIHDEKQVILKKLQDKSLFGEAF